MAVVKSREGQILILGDYRKVNRKLRAMKFSNESYHSPATFPVLPLGTGTPGGSLQLHLIPRPGTRPGVLQGILGSVLIMTSVGWWWWVDYINSLSRPGNYYNNEQRR